MWETRFCTVLREMPREQAMCRLLAPSASRLSTSRSRPVRPPWGGGGTARLWRRGGGEEPGGDPGAEHGASCRDCAQRGGDLVAGGAFEDVSAGAGGQGGVNAGIVSDAVGGLSRDVTSALVRSA